jgi:GGDEF domain-containing protein
MQQIADGSGSLVVAEGIETAEDFRMVKDLGIACGQGWFIGRPTAKPCAALPAEVKRADDDTRVPVIRAPRRRLSREPCARDFVHAVAPASPGDPLGGLLERFGRHPQLAAIPVVGAQGIAGVVSRSWHDVAEASLPIGGRACADFVDPTPIRVEPDTALAGLAALLTRADARRAADGFVIQSRGRYVGMGLTQDVVRSLHTAQVLASRYTHPLTLLPGEVPIHEHLSRLLASGGEFCAWYALVDRLRGLNDVLGFETGDALIHSTARLLESACEPGVDFVGHSSGSRLVVLMQSEDWEGRARGVLERCPAILGEHVPREARERGHFLVPSRDGLGQRVPLPRLAIGILRVAPGRCESRHEVLAGAKRACQRAQAFPGHSLHVDSLPDERADPPRASAG